MNKYSVFLEGQGFFGSYPYEGDIETLQNHGIKYFVDLTCVDEELPEYTVSPECKKIKLEVYDRKVPYDLFAFTVVLLKCNQLLNRGEKIYIHCKGGHGRSGILVACLLILQKNVSPEEAIEMTTQSHNAREGMKEKWKRIGSPQTISQKNFVGNLFKPFRFFKAYRHGKTVGLSAFSLHPVECKIGTSRHVFPHLEAAFQAHKKPHDNVYIEKLKKLAPVNARMLGKKQVVPRKWEKEQHKIMKKLLYLKCCQNAEVMTTVLNSGLRPFVEHTRTDRYWGDGGDGTGYNYLGKLWSEIRERLYDDILSKNYNY